MRSILLLGVLAAAISTQASAQTADGKALYDQFCKKCHGVRGVPPGPMKKKFEKIAALDAPFMLKRSDDSVVTVLVKGSSDDMKTFKEKMKPDEMMAVAKYVRELANKSKP